MKRRGKRRTTLATLLLTLLLSAGLWSFAAEEATAQGRWYPTATTLGDGSVMTFSGLSEIGLTNTTVEIYRVGAGWSPEYASGWVAPLYLRMHLLPNGDVVA